MTFKVIMQAVMLSLEKWDDAQSICCSFLLYCPSSFSFFRG